MPLHHDVEQGPVHQMFTRHNTGSGIRPFEDIIVLKQAELESTINLELRQLIGILSRGD